MSAVVDETCSCGASTHYQGNWPDMFMLCWRRDHRHEFPPPVPAPDDAATEEKSQ